MADSPLLKGLDIHLLMAGQARPRLERSLEDARQSLQDAGFKVTAAMEAGEVDTIVARAVKSDHYDLLVMGAYSHSPWRSLLLGSKTTELLKASQIAALLLR